MKRALLGLCLPLSLPAQDARAILEKAEQAGQSGRSYGAEFTGSIQYQGLAQTLAFSGSMLVEQPDHMRSEMQMGPIHMLVLRNGPQYTVYVPEANQYASFRRATLAQWNPGISAMANDLAAGLQSARRLRDEDVTVEGRALRCYVISAESNSGYRGLYWMEQTSYLVLRSRLEMSVPTAQGATAATSDFLLTKFSPLARIDRAAFNFVPPRGATQAAIPGVTVQTRIAPSQAAPVPQAPAPVNPGSNRASVVAESVTLYAKMSESSPEIAILHKNDAVTIDFSIGGWCAVHQANVGAADSRSGNLRCDSLKKEP